MAARIIPFPKPVQVQGGTPIDFARMIHAVEMSSAAQTQRVLVMPTRLPAAEESPSQQAALRIVEAVSADLKRAPRGATAQDTDRAPQFWATLPTPIAARETPFSVARRLAHLILTTNAIA